MPRPPVEEQVRMLISMIADQQHRIGMLENNVEMLKRNRFGWK